MEKNEKKTQVEENQETVILVDGKEVKDVKKVGIGAKIGGGIKKVGSFVWNHKGAIIGAAAGFGLKCLLDMRSSGDDGDEILSDESNSSDDEFPSD